MQLILRWRKRVTQCTPEYSADNKLNIKINEHYTEIL